MKHLLKSGLVSFKGESVPGSILFTESFVFALRARNDAMMAGGILGGLFGALIGGFIDSKRAKKTTPEHLNHPEIVGLDNATRKQLMTTELLCAIPMNMGLKTKEIDGGFTFSSEGYAEVCYKGRIHKKRVLAYLQERGVPVVQ